MVVLDLAHREKLATDRAVTISGAELPRPEPQEVSSVLQALAGELREKREALSLDGMARAAPEKVHGSPEREASMQGVQTELARSILAVAEEMRDLLSEATNIPLSKYKVVLCPGSEREGQTPMEIVLERDVRNGYARDPAIQIHPEHPTVRSDVGTMIVAGHELAHALDEQLGYPTAALLRRDAPFRVAEHVIMGRFPSEVVPEGA